MTAEIGNTNKETRLLKQYLRQFSATPPAPRLKPGATQTKPTYVGLKPTKPA
ncbi:hypothetical protein MiSe_04830 [Microseira wollei NIES-4236]|uniref:Uncharacterized protein n=1 Tax=Microseira wollei NIES-4236 TaxID=2530354 RepID=A0AAV3X0Q0_9CYAN|nr:hypothetical protein MiSe_04830 [Microseira wollei NIES-4236]